MLTPTPVTLAQPWLFQAVRAFRLVLPLMLAFVLSSCQPPTFDVTAKIQSRNIVFEGHGAKGLLQRLLGWSDDTIDFVYLEVVTEKEVLWAIKFDDTEKDCTAPTANPNYRKPIAGRFPIAYGTIFKCFITVVPPQKLPVGVTMTVRSEGDRDGSGHFQIEQMVRNFSWDELQHKPDLSAPLPTRNPYWAPIRGAVESGSNEAAGNISDRLSGNE